MSNVAVGFKPRTGRAVLVMLESDDNGVRVMERREVPLLPAGEMDPYDAAEGLEPQAAREHVERSIATAQRLAVEVIRAAEQRCVQARHRLCGCGVLVGTGMPDWTTDEILAVHVRMHKAEGELFRDVLVAGARACGFEPATLPDKSALDAAARVLHLSRAQLDARLEQLGKSAGAPWGAYQKEAAAAALVALDRDAGHR